MFKRSTLLCLLLISEIVSAAGSTVDNTAKVTALLTHLEETRRAAIAEGDEKTLDRIYADDFKAIAGNGQVIDKRTLMSVFKRNDPSVIFTTTEIVVRVFDKTAIFTGRLTGRTKDGRVVSDARFTHFFANRGGRWQIVGGQSTVIASQ